MFITGFDNDGGFFEQSLRGNVDAVASCLAESTAHAPVRNQQRSEFTGAFDRPTGFVNFGTNSNELECVVASGRAFIDAELAGFTLNGRQVDSLMSARPILA